MDGDHRAAERRECELPAVRAGMVAPRQARFYPNGLMFRVIRLIIRVYQYILSPVLDLLSGPGSGCRFQPTCSHYLSQAMEWHGIIHGGWLALKRIARCQPWGGCGSDPV